MKYTLEKFTGLLLVKTLVCISLSTIVSQSTDATKKTKSTWLAQQVNQHPDIVSARETISGCCILYGRRR